MGKRSLRNVINHSLSQDTANTTNATHLLTDLTLIIEVLDCYSSVQLRKEITVADQCKYREPGRIGTLFFPVKPQSLASNWTTMIWQHNTRKTHLYADLIELLQLGTHQIAELVHSNYLNFCRLYCQFLPWLAQSSPCAQAISACHLFVQMRFCSRTPQRCMFRPHLPDSSTRTFSFGAVFWIIN